VWASGLRNGEVHHPALDRRGSLNGINVQDSVQPIQRDHNPIAMWHRATGQPRAAASSDYRHVMFVTPSHRRHDLVGGLGKDHPARPSGVREQPV
jgi:hypothetical protein